MTQVKVTFESDEGTESLWATPAEHGFVIDNYPFYLKGVNFGDLVDATAVSPGLYKYVRTIAKSPHSLYRVLFEAAHGPRATELLNSLTGIGCSYEQGEIDGFVLVAVHIPGTADANAAWRILETGLNEGTWEVQEGEDRHPCPDDSQP
jgi:hypothetical protein